MTGASRHSAKVMSLRGLLTLATSVLLLLLLVGNLLLNVSNTRHFLQQQLAIHAQDAATSLGLSLSAQGADEVMTERLVAAMFDSGYYQRIEIQDVQGTPRLVREHASAIIGVPAWFVQLVPLQTPQGQAELMQGWTRKGQVLIHSHPGFAYLKLWQALKVQTSMFVVSLVLVLLLLQWLLSRLLKPLQQAETQAEAVAQNNFSFRSPERGTREVRRVTRALNHMADRLGQVFREQLGLIEQLRQTAFRDVVTGLGNRQDFDRRLEVELSSEHQTPATLLLLQIGQFAEFNQQQGRAQGDALLQRVANQLCTALQPWPEAYAGRRAGADFAVYIPGLTPSRAEPFVASLMGGLTTASDLQSQQGGTEVKPRFYAGWIAFTPPEDARALLAKADLALRSAQLQERPSVAYAELQKPDTPAITVPDMGAGEWAMLLQEKLAADQLHLQQQPVQDTFGQPRYQQLLARLEMNGERVAAQRFLPMVENSGMSVTLDLNVLEKAVALLQDDPELRLGVSLSLATLRAAELPAWLREHLASHRIAERLHLSILEFALQHDESYVERLLALAGELGFRVAIDRFGLAPVAFGYLQRLAFDHIKVDQRFVRGVATHQEHQFFLRAIVQIAHSQGMKVIAVGVETEDEWETLITLGFDGGMGYYLGRPETPDLNKRV
ncbi:MAG: EAL domain-containing protein [Hahellaceae bacterium]|nr:EAL domain-containing protein [Hahellaceae bacterium]MCP5169658.1 EAL domain-containing protein [Hahellaceae bacterium]